MNVLICVGLALLLWIAISIIVSLVVSAIAKRRDREGQ